MMMLMQLLRPRSLARCSRVNVSRKIPTAVDICGAGHRICSRVSVLFAFPPFLFQDWLIGTRPHLPSTLTHLLQDKSRAGKQTGASKPRNKLQGTPIFQPANMAAAALPRSLPPSVPGSLPRSLARLPACLSACPPLSSEGDVASSNRLRSPLSTANGHTTLNTPLLV